MLSQENRVRVMSLIFIGASSAQAPKYLLEYDFADNLAVDQGLYRLGHLAQREAAPDARLELTLCGQIDQCLCVGGGDFGVGFVEPADPHADRFDPFDQQVVGAGECRRTAKKPQDQDAPAPGQAAQRLLEGRTVDRVVNDVDAATPGQLHDLVAEAGLVIDHMRRTLDSADRSLLLGARGRDDFGPEKLGDLNRRDADAAGSTVDQYPVAFLEPPSLQ